MQKSPESKINYPLSSYIKDLWKYTKGFHRRLSFWFSIRSLAPLISLLTPFITATIVDHLANKTATPFFIGQMLVLFFIIISLRLFLRNRSNFQINKLNDKVRLKIRQQGVSKLLDFDLSWHEKEASGKKVTIVTRGADSVRQIIRFLRTGGGGLDIFINIIAVLFIFATLDWRYFLISILNVFVYLYINHYNNQQINPKKHLLNLDYEKVMAKNFEYFSNMNLIKSLGIGHQINNVLFVKENEYTDKSIHVGYLDFNKWLYINNISNIFNILITALVVFDIYNGKISIGSFFIYTGYITRLQDSLGGIAESINEVIDNQLAFYRMVQLLNSGSTKTNCGHQSFPKDFDSINFTNVNFHYPNSKTNTLNDVNFKIKVGEKIGIVGASGSGKSTITKLLLRLYLIDSGHITFNQVPINKISPSELRKSLAIVPQDSEIFNLTFRENISIASGNINIDKDIYELSLKVAECQPMLDKIKNNHQTLLGEKGIKLSGGERQRLGIARAIYKNANILVFDESTSSLDSKTEEKILNNIESLLKAKTILWIAHRLSTLRFTDKIIVFDQGKVVETGSFKELISLKGHFHQLWQIQKKTKMK